MDSRRRRGGFWPQLTRAKRNPGALKNNGFIGIFHCYCLGGAANPWPNATMKSSGTAAKNTTNEKEKTMTKTTNTTIANEPGMTADAMRRELAMEIADAKERYETARATFLTDSQESPEFAITWQSKDVIAAEIEQKVLRQIERDLETRGPADVLEKAIEDCRLSARPPLASTDPFVSAVLRAKADTYMRLVERLAVMQRFLGR